MGTTIPQPKRKHDYLIGDSILFGWKPRTYSPPEAWKEAHVTNATEEMIQVEYKVLFWKRRKWLVPYRPSVLVRDVYAVVKTVF
jgi:hypothetical protein